MTYKWSETSISICGHFVIPTSNSKANLSSPSPAFFTLWLNDTKSLIEIFIFTKNKTATKINLFKIYDLHVILQTVCDWNCPFLCNLSSNSHFFIGKIVICEFLWFQFHQHFKSSAFAPIFLGRKVQTKNVSTKKL